MISFKIYTKPEKKCELYIDESKMGNCTLSGFMEDRGVLYFNVTKDGSFRITTLLCNLPCTEMTKSTLRCIQNVLMEFAPKEQSYQFFADGDNEAAQFAPRMRLLIQ